MTTLDDETVVELTDIFHIDSNNNSGPTAAELGMEPRGSSVKSTPRSLMKVPSPWTKVAENAPHFLDSKRKFFFRLTLPFLLASVIQMYYVWKDCHAAYEEVDYEGERICFNPVAELLNLFFFIAVHITGYQVRKELILGSPLIFSFVEQMSSSDVKQLKIKNLKEWVNVLTGKHENFRPWNIRGQVLLPAITFLGIFSFVFRNTYLRLYDDSTCNAGASSCGPDNVYALSNAMMILLPLRFALSWSYMVYAIMTAAVPLIVVSLIVVSSVKSRIGLWNQGDVSLSELQRISMHASLYMSGFACILILYTVQYEAYFGTGLFAQAFYILLLLGILVVILFVPIIPAISALRNIKDQVLADVFALEEQANNIFLDLLRVGTKGRLTMKPGEVEQAEAELARIVKYRLQVEDASVVPSSLALIKTYLSSVLLGVVLPFVLSRALGSD